MGLSGTNADEEGEQAVAGQQPLIKKPKCQKPERVRKVTNEARAHFDLTGGGRDCIHCWHLLRNSVEARLTKHVRHKRSVSLFCG